MIRDASRGSRRSQARIWGKGERALISSVWADGGERNDGRKKDWEKAFPCQNIGEE